MMSRSNYLQIRLSEVEQANYRRFAEKYQLSVAEWARNQLNWIVRVGVVPPENTNRCTTLLDLLASLGLEPEWCNLVEDGPNGLRHRPTDGLAAVKLETLVARLVEGLEDLGWRRISKDRDVESENKAGS